MTKKARLKEHLHALNKIGTIITAMKNLSLIEMNKVTKCLATQEKMHATIAQIGSDFLTFYPQFYSQMHVDKANIYILIGSERGFCGNFNDNLIHYLERQTPLYTESKLKLIVVGRKLATKLVNDKRVIHVIDGPNTMDEVSDIIFNLINILMLDFSKFNLNPGWSVVFNKKNNTSVQTLFQQPFSEFKNTKSQAFSIPPQLNLSKETFMIEFINQYLFSMLYTLFYQSFFCENYCRSNQLESALDRLEKKVNKLTRNLNLLRQEEITQEIQMIMLSADIILEEIQDKLIRPSNKLFHQ